MLPMQFLRNPSDRLPSLRHFPLNKVAHVLIGNVLSSTISLLSMIWFARVLGTRVMGDYAAILVGIQLVAGLIVPGFNQAVIREPSRQEIASAAILATILQSAIMLILALAIGAFIYLQYPETFSLMFFPMVLLLLSIILSLWTYLFAAPLEAGLDYQYLVKTRIFASLAGVLTGIALAEGGYGIFALVIRDLMLSLVSLILVRIHSPLPLILNGWQKGMVSLMQFARGLWALNVLEKLALRIDYAFVGFILGKEELGIYYAIRGLVEGVLGFIIYPVQTVVYSFYCRLEDVSEFVRLYLGKAILGAIGLATVTVFGTFAIGPAIVFVIFGQGYQTGDKLFPGLVLYAFGLMWFENIKVLALSQNRHQAMQLGRIAQLGISVILIFPLARLLGLSGAGISAGLGAVALAVLSTRLLLQWRSQLQTDFYPSTSRG